jgi:CAAX protease family protein
VTPARVSGNAGLRTRVTVGYVAAIGAAEASIAIASEPAGAIAYGIVLVVMLTHACLVPPDAREPRILAQRNAIVALSLLPILRLVSLTAPVGADSTTARYLLVGGLMLGGVAAAVWGVRLPGVSFRPRHVLFQFGVLWVVVPLALLVSDVVDPPRITAEETWPQLTAAAVAVALAAIVEEIVFRGLIQTTLGRVYGPVTGVLGATLLYVIAYLGVRPLSLVLCAAVLGLLFGWVAQRTGTLIGVAIGHSLFNIALFVVLPLLALSKG